MAINWGQNTQSSTGGINWGQSSSQPPQTPQPKQSFSDQIWNGIGGVSDFLTKNNFPGAQLGQAVGNSVGGLIGAGGAAFQGDFKTAGDILNSTNQQNNQNYSRVVGDTVQSAVLPASLALGGGTGTTVVGRLGNAALKYGASGALSSAGNTAAGGGDLKQTAESGLVGGTIGAGLGALGQSIGEGISYLKSAQPVSEQEALDITRSSLNKKGAIDALEKSGQPGGAVKQGLLGNVSVEPTPRDIRVAQSVQDSLVKGDPISSIANINSKIEDIAENQIRPALQQSPSAFNLKTLNSYIESNTQVPNYIKADPVLQKTYDLTRESMIEEAANQPKTLEGLWDARKSFDAIAARQGVGLDPMSDKASVIKQAVLDTRRAVNDFIVENHPEGQSVFGKPMQLLNQMYEARGNIATSNYKALGTNAITRWIKANPTKAKFLGYGVGAIGAEKVLKGVGVPLP